MTGECSIILFDEEGERKLTDEEQISMISQNQMTEKGSLSDMASYCNAPFGPPCFLPINFVNLTISREIIG